MTEGPPIGGRRHRCAVLELASEVRLIGITALEPDGAQRMGTVHEQACGGFGSDCAQQSLETTLVTQSSLEASLRDAELDGDVVQGPTPPEVACEQAAHSRHDIVTTIRPSGTSSRSRGSPTEPPLPGTDIGQWCDELAVREHDPLAGTGRDNKAVCADHRQQNRKHAKHKCVLGRLGWCPERPHVLDLVRSVGLRSGHDSMTRTRELLQPAPSLKEFRRRGGVQQSRDHRIGRHPRYHPPDAQQRHQPVPRCDIPQEPALRVERQKCPAGHGSSSDDVVGGERSPHRRNKRRAGELLHRTPPASALNHTLRRAGRRRLE